MAAKSKIIKVRARNRPVALTSLSMAFPHTKGYIIASPSWCTKLHWPSSYPALFHPSVVNVLHVHSNSILFDSTHARIEALLQLVNYRVRCDCHRIEAATCISKHGNSYSQNDGVSCNGSIGWDLSRQMCTAVVLLEVILCCRPYLVSLLFAILLSQCLHLDRWCMLSLVTTTPPRK